MGHEHEEEKKKELEQNDPLSAIPTGEHEHKDASKKKQSDELRSLVESAKTRSEGGGEGEKPYNGMDDGELARSKGSYEDLIVEHEQKLADYLADPDAHDNKGMLQGKTPELREKIIQGRANAIRKQIKKQRGELEKIKREIARRHKG